MVHDFEIFWADQRTAEIMEAGSTEDSASGLCKKNCVASL